MTIRKPRRLACSIPFHRGHFLAAALLLALAGCATTRQEEVTQGSMFGGSAAPLAGEEPRDPVQQRAGLLLASGRTAEMDGKLDRAVESYRKILAESPQHAEASHRLAVCYSRQGKPAEAEPFFQQALAQQPHDAELACDIGYACYLQDRWEEAEHHFRRALEIKPSLNRARLNLAMICARTGRVPEAMAEFARGGCRSAEAKANVAFAAMLDGQWDAAIAFYSDALAEQPALDKAKSGIERARRLKEQSAAARLADRTAPPLPAPGAPRGTWPAADGIQASYQAPGGP